MRIGITGHQNISDRCARLVRAEIDRALARSGAGLVGLTSLAAGADQIFAEAVLSAGGQLSVVLPSDHIESSFQDPHARDRFAMLIAQAADVRRLSFERPGEEAYWAAGRVIADSSELLLAVWDGRPATGLGGTADVVQYARGRSINVTVIWPSECTRG